MFRYFNIVKLKVNTKLMKKAVPLYITEKKKEKPIENTGDLYPTILNFAYNKGK